MTSFEKWFSSDWNKMLHGADDEGEALSNGRIRHASWDRRAAYLMWVQLGRPPAQWATIYPIKPKGHVLSPDPVFEAIAQDDDDLLAGPAPAPAYDDEDLLS